MSWPLVKLGEIFEITSSKRVHQKDWRTEGVPFYRAREVAVLSREGKVDNDLFIEETMYEEYKTKFGAPKEGDILITAVGTLGLTYAVKKDDRFYFKDASVIRLSKKVEVDTKYIQYAIASPNVQRFIQNSNGATVGTYTINRAKETEIPLPPLEIQKKIADVLEKADQLRKDCQQMEQELNSLAQAVFIDMFGDPVTNPKGWDIGTIGELVSSVNYGTSEKASTEELMYPVLRMNNITYQGSWDFSSLKYIDLSEKDEEKYLVNSGDILFNRTNSKELVGKTAVYRESEPMAFAGYLVRARCNELANPEYISAFMNSSYGKQTLQNMCKSIVGMANINAKEFQGIKIAKPPIEIQNDFAKRVSGILSLVNESKLQQDEYESNFNALMQKAFKGELNLNA